MTRKVRLVARFIHLCVRQEVVVFADTERYFRELKPAVEFCALRVVRERHEVLSVRRDVVEPVRLKEDLGAMITVFNGGGMGYAATSDLSRSGLRRGIAEASTWARVCAGRMLMAMSHLDREVRQGVYKTPVARPWAQVPLGDKLALLRRESSRLKVDDQVVDWEASLWFGHTQTCYLTADGSRIEQEFQTLLPALSAIAQRHGEAQRRSFGNDAYFRQGGMEVLDEIGFLQVAPEIGEQALQLLSAPNCPTGALDLVLGPEQMALQIHESIGHPLELDRILGDERNYAGTSFVTPAMFGHYRYGSEHLNVTFDPTQPQQVASYGYDDEGHPAGREYIIEKGILRRPLGGALSQARAGLAGVANSRACSWNRPPIDRMANLNLEPGEHSFAELIAAVEQGVYMETNCSWSIDDSRNKFQFGCEWARLIENGELTRVVKNPNYRGVSADFWRSLAGVGDASTWRTMGVANCGKGEPNQAIRVGHAAPPCWFRNAAVFGGE